MYRDFIELLKLFAKWDKLLGDHGDELLGVLPLADVIVDFVEEVLAANLEVLEVALAGEAGAVAVLLAIVLVPWAVHDGLVGIGLLAILILCSILCCVRLFSCCLLSSVWLLGSGLLRGVDLLSCSGSLVVLNKR